MHEARAPFGACYRFEACRQINAAIHRVAVTRARCHPETRAYRDRKRAEGKSTREAIRCLKRHLARRIWHLLEPPNPRRLSRGLFEGPAKRVASLGPQA